MDQLIPDAGALRCIVYCSHADDLWSDADLASLFAHARAKNRQLGITGLITYRHRQFVQNWKDRKPRWRRFSPASNKTPANTGFA